MNGLMKKAGLGIALAATALTAAVPADAQRWGRGYRGGGWGGYHHRGGGNVAGAAVLRRHRTRLTRPHGSPAGCRTSGSPGRRK